jgi:hypothetical protein
VLFRRSHTPGHNHTPRLRQWSSAYLRQLAGGRSRKLLALPPLWAGASDQISRTAQEAGLGFGPCSNHTGGGLRCPVAQIAYLAWPAWCKYLPSRSKGILRNGLHPNATDCTQTQRNATSRDDMHHCLDFPVGRVLASGCNRQKQPVATDRSWLRCFVHGANVDAPLVSFGALL